MCALQLASSPCLPHLERKACMQQQKPITAKKINKYCFKVKKKKRVGYPWPTLSAHEEENSLVL